MDEELEKRENQHASSTSTGYVSNMCCRIWKDASEDTCPLPKCGCGVIHHDLANIYVSTVSVFVPFDLIQLSLVMGLFFRIALQVL